MNEDFVNHPSHYNQGNIECIDALNAMVTGFKDSVDASLSWQVVKYVWRHPFKGKNLEDLEKARFYLGRLIEYLEKKNIDKKPDEKKSLTSGHHVKLKENACQVNGEKIPKDYKNKNLWIVDVDITDNGKKTLYLIDENNMEKMIQVYEEDIINDVGC